MKTVSSYEQQGIDFLEKTKTKMAVEYIGHDFYFDDDKEKRDIYRITLTREIIPTPANLSGPVFKTYSFRFGQSIAHSRKNGFVTKETKKPRAYDVLACLTKYDPGTLDEFASEYGYDGEKISKVIKTYNAVVEEWKNVQNLFGDVLEELGEIQ